MSSHRREEIRAILRQIGVNVLDDDEALLDSGLLDSRVVVDLVAALEGHYRITLDLSDLDLDDLSSVTSIALFVDAKIAA